MFEGAVASIIPAAGFAAVYPELIPQKNQFYSMNNLDKMLYMIRAYKDEQVSLFSSEDSQCGVELNASLTLAVSQFH